MNLMLFVPKESEIAGEPQVLNTVYPNAGQGRIAFPDMHREEFGDVISDSRISANFKFGIGKLHFQPQSYNSLNPQPEILMICLIIASLRSRTIPRISPHAHPRIRGTNFAALTCFPRLFCFSIKNDMDNKVELRGEGNYKNNRPVYHITFPFHQTSFFIYSTRY